MDRKLDNSIKKAINIVTDAAARISNGISPSLDGKTQLPEHESKSIIKEFGIETTNPVLTQTVDEAVEAANFIGYPVVLKVVSPSIIHKSDAAGVEVNIPDSDTLRTSFNKMLNAITLGFPGVEITGFLVERMAEPSTEVIIGAVRDPQFGPTVMFGLGGIFVEVVKDVSLCLAPVNEKEAREMISEIKAYPLLTGFRGSKPLDISSIAKAILSISQIITTIPQIMEIDLNPLFVYPEGIIAVDARIIIEV